MGNRLLDIFMLILVRDFDVFATRFKLDADSFTKALIVCGEGELKRIGYVVIPATMLIFFRPGGV